MNPSEIYQFLTTLIRDGAEVLAGALIALGFGLFFGYKFRGWWWKEKEQVEKAQEETRDFQVKWTEEKDNLSKARNDYTLALEEKNNRIGKLQGDLEVQSKKLERYTKGLFQARDKFNYLTGALEKAKEDVATANAALARANQENEELAIQVRQASEERDEARDETDCLKKQLQDAEQANREFENKLAEAKSDLDRRIQDMLEQGGRVWERPIPADAPPFVPLGEDRRCPILSLLNLKGGVGKTTIALNLAASLADRGKRVLMIDCDHQRSLTSLCLRQTRRNELHAARQTLQHFLLGPDRTPQSFLSTIYTPLGMKTCSLVANTPSSDKAGMDGLASVEDRLMLEWLYLAGSVDARFLLREVLHSREINDRFDYVILDCPPRLSTATVNALVASDGILIPVLLDATSATLPLPHLLRELRRLHTPKLFPDFGLLGVVANEVKTRLGQLVSHQAPIWNGLPTAIHPAWNQPVPLLKTMIPHDSAYSRAAKPISRDAEHAVAIWSDPDVRTIFSALTDEILKRIADEAPHLAAVSS